MSDDDDKKLVKTASEIGALKTIPDVGTRSVRCHKVILGTGDCLSSFNLASSVPQALLKKYSDKEQDQTNSSYKKQKLPLRHK